MGKEEKVNDDDKDEDEEEEKEYHHDKYYKNDPIEVFNKEKSVWIRGVFVGEYLNYKNVKEYFVEIPDVLESQIIGIESKYVRYLQEEMAMDDEVKMDEQKEEEKYSLNS